MAGKGKTTTITGILYPVYDGDYEHITGVMLSGIDESEYLVISDKFLSDLIQLCQEEVSLRGKVGLKDGIKTIAVEDYRIVSRLYDDMLDDDSQSFLD
ncbi:MAG: hypothetical protein V3573_02495 [Desulfovibrionaceae bacterium]